ncbi:MAG: hypothetical protein A3F14_06060 [Gammaproteobacteria bacterium RIFCSPHIGHO2_12_FULL_43_28]|nr:MAG: hypothetical protein A3F14_06060 [Gammaproteobacteria bacterium RIFCSPHIGHO2_12_FULL_43_28]
MITDITNPTKVTETTSLLQQQRIEKLEKIAKDVGELPKSKEQGIFLQQIKLLQTDIKGNIRVNKLEEKLDQLEKEYLLLQNKVALEAEQHLRRDLIKKQANSENTTNLLHEKSEAISTILNGSQGFKKINPTPSRSFSSKLFSFFCPCFKESTSQYKKIPSNPNSTSLRH